MTRPFFGWWIVIGSALIHAVHGSTFGFVFGVYLLQWQHSFGWSRFAISSTFSLSQLVNGLLAPMQGFLTDRFGTRLLMNSGTVLFGISLVGLGTINNLGTLFVFVLLIGIGANASGFLTMNASLANWFLRRRALAMGLGTTGMGLGGTLAPVVAWGIVTYGWRPIAIVSGLVVLIIGLPLAQLFRHRPEDYGYYPDGDKARVRTNPEGPSAFEDGNPPDFSAVEALQDRNFWLVSFGHALALLAVISIMVHLVPHLVKNVGWSETSAQFLFTVITVTSVLGQIIGGYLGDLYSKSKVAAWCMLGHSTAMIVLALTRNGPLILLAAVLHGLSWGMRGPLMMAIRADYYGRTNFATIAGLSSAIVMAGPLVGPAFAGAMSDYFGDYTAAFLIVGMLTGLGSIFFFTARNPRLVRRHG